MTGRLKFFEKIFYIPVYKHALSVLISEGNFSDW